MKFVCSIEIKNKRRDIVEFIRSPFRAERLEETDDIGTESNIYVGRKLININTLYEGTEDLSELDPYDYDYNSKVDILRAFAESQNMYLSDLEYNDNEEDELNDDNNDNVSESIINNIVENNPNAKLNELANIVLHAAGYRSMFF